MTVHAAEAALLQDVYEGARTDGGSISDYDKAQWLQLGEGLEKSFQVPTTTLSLPYYPSSRRDGGLSWPGLRLPFSVSLEGMGRA